MKKNFLDILKAKRKEQEKEIRKLDKVFSDLDKLTELMIKENEKMINNVLTQL